MLKNTHIWLSSYFLQALKRSIQPQANKPLHIMFSCVDHFEPDWQGANSETQLKRVKRWLEDYPKLAKQHKDADGCHPKHTFFYPAEVYTKEHLDLLATICREGLGEVEIHLHHDEDTEESLKEKLEKAKKDFSSHGLLSKRALSGQVRFGFIHGNWALNNSRRDRRFCGVNNEAKVLSEAGCYADFTFPSAPSETQPQKINSIYYTKSNRQKPKSHNTGIDAKVGRFTNGDLLIIQGPLALNWARRAQGIFPRIENGDITAANPPTSDRVDLWVGQHIHVKGKEDWIFVKVHTHGAQESNADVLLGEPMRSMYNYLETRYNDGKNFVLHYVSSREMYNIVKAAEAREQGSPHQYRNYILERNN